MLCAFVRLHYTSLAGSPLPPSHSLTKQHFFHHIDMGGGLCAPMGLQMESFELRMRYSSNFLLSVGEIELLHLPRWGKGDGWG